MCTSKLWLMYKKWYMYHSLRNHSVTSKPRPPVCLQTSQNGKGSGNETWQGSNGWWCHFQQGYNWREMEGRWRQQQFRHPTSSSHNSLALNTAMAIFEHNPNFEWTSKMKGASRKICACYTLNRWKKAAAHSSVDSWRNLDPPSQNSLQDALPNHCPNHCTPLYDDHAEDPPDPPVPFTIIFPSIPTKRASTHLNILASFSQQQRRKGTRTQRQEKCYSPAVCIMHFC